MKETHLHTAIKRSVRNAWDNSNTASWKVGGVWILVSLFTLAWSSLPKQRATHLLHGFWKAVKSKPKSIRGGGRW